MIVGNVMGEMVERRNQPDIGTMATSLDRLTIVVEQQIDTQIAAPTAPSARTAASVILRTRRTTVAPAAETLNTRPEAPCPSRAPPRRRTPT
jgi:hypothetical protein